MTFNVAKFAGGLALALASVGSAQATLYFNDFNSGAGAEFTISGAGFAGSVESVQGFAAATGNNFSGNLLRNTATGNPAAVSRLTLTGLSAHDHISFSSLIAFLDTWDSSDGGCCAPDFFNIKVDGVSLLQATDNNILGTVSTLNGANGGTRIASGQMGFGGFLDRGYTYATSFAHTASSITIDFFSSGAGWQGGVDESWAIDNLRIETECRSTSGCGTPNLAPEPGSLALFGLGVVALVARRRYAAHV